MAYCTVADAIAKKRRGTLDNPARDARASASGDYLECEGHGLADGAEVTLRAHTGGSLPAPLVDTSTYYARVVSTSRFQLAATAGGAAINFTSAGSNFTFYSPLPWQAWIDSAAAMIDSVLPHNVTPLVEPYPAILVTYCAELAALIGLERTSGVDAETFDSRQRLLDQLMKWARGPSGPPLRGAARSVTSPSHLAVSASAGAVDPRGWATRGNERLP